MLLWRRDSDASNFKEAEVETQKESEEELLLPIERRAIPDHYRPYYATKRNNFFASIQISPDLWRYYQMLDNILLNEFRDLDVSHDPDRLIPLTLFFNAHAKIRISIELAFTRCMEEARSILRDAIETAVYAHRMHAEPDLQKVWLCKNDSKEAANKFSEAFEKKKTERLFEGLTELYERWGQLCETGAHSTPQAVVSRFKIDESATHVQYRLNYTGVEDREWEPETFTLLQTVSFIERLVFSDYESRLKLDHTLVQNRVLAQSFHEQLRQSIIRKHDIKPPQPQPQPQP